MFCKLLVWVLTGAGSHCQQVTYSNKDVETWERVSLLACDPDWVSAITLWSRRLFCVGSPQLDADRLVGHRISAFLGYWRYLSTQKAWGNPFIWHSIFGISCTLLLNSKWELNINFFDGIHGHYLYHFVEFIIFFLYIPLVSVLLYTTKETLVLYTILVFCHHYSRLAPGF